jgi:imidazolonepropionase-like amidohydrolase
MQIPVRQAFASLQRPPFTFMRKIAPFALVFITLVSVQLSAQSPASVTLVKAGRLLDPRTGNVLTPAFVLIEGDKVKQIGSSFQIGVPSGAKIIDLAGATLLPGLIDAHTHLFLDIIVPPEAEMSRHLNGLFAPGLLLAVVESPAKRAFLGAQMAREDLESGITTVRNLATPVLTATLNYAMRSTPAESSARESWPPHAS